MRSILILFVSLSGCFAARAADEHIRGILEKTTKAGACAQIKDALDEIYYVNKTDQAEKAIAGFVGKNQKVVVTGTVENKEGDPANYLVLKSVEAYNPKLPPPPPPPVEEKKAEPKPSEAKPEEKPEEKK